VWSPRDHGANFVDLTGPSEPPAPKEEDDDDSDDWSFGTSSDDSNNLDFSVFDARTPLLAFFVFSLNCIFVQI
jgi:hypothetical protein